MSMLNKGIDRRQFLALGVGATTIALLPRFAVAASSPSDTRFLLVFLRGGLDGLHALQPVGDLAFASLRGSFLDAGKQPVSHRLDSTFALHGGLGFMASLHARKQLLPIAAVAPPYRQRSHFEAQDCVENGTAGSGGSTGWMNRCVAAMPGSKGLAVAAVMPLAMRGSAETTTWSPPLPEQVDPILWQRLQLLYAADPALSRSFAELGSGDASADAMQGGKQARVARLVPSMTAAAKFMSAAQGPRIGFVEDTGWDTHGNQIGVLDRKLAELDAGLKAFHDGAQPIWRTGGTDHGTGGSAFLAGGAVNGGRVAGDWPGVAKAQLNDGRDLRATTDMRGLFKGVLRDHLGIGDAMLVRSVFPESGTIPAMRDLVLNV